MLHRLCSLRSATTDIPSVVAKWRGPLAPHPGEAHTQAPRGRGRVYPSSCPDGAINIRGCHIDQGHRNWAANPGWKLLVVMQKLPVARAEVPEQGSMFDWEAVVVRLAASIGTAMMLQLVVWGAFVIRAQEHMFLT